MIVFYEMIFSLLYFISRSVIDYFTFIDSCSIDGGINKKDIGQQGGRFCSRRCPRNTGMSNNWQQTPTNSNVVQKRQKCYQIHRGELFN